MDVRVTRGTVGIITSLFRKPTFTGLYTPWDSFSPTIYKINLIRALTQDYADLLAVGSRGGVRRPSWDLAKERLPWAFIPQMDYNRPH